MILVTKGSLVLLDKQEEEFTPEQRELEEGQEEWEAEYQVVWRESQEVYYLDVTEYVFICINSFGNLDTLRL